MRQNIERTLPTYAFAPDFIGPMTVGIEWFFLPFQLRFLLSLCPPLVVLRSELYQDLCYGRIYAVILPLSPILAISQLASATTPRAMAASSMLIKGTLTLPWSVVVLGSKPSY